MLNVHPEGINLLGDCDFEEHDLYFIFYPEKTISREARKRLKELGYRLQRHSRSNEEIWVYAKPLAQE